MCSHDPSPIAKLFAILENIVRYDLSDIKSDLVRDNIIDARNIAKRAFNEELNAPVTALVEAFANEDRAHA